MYWISGDSINPAYQMLLLDCFDLRAEKRYMYCILNICQAYEMFFSLYFRSLIYRAFVKDRDLDRVNDLLERLHGSMTRFAFASLRCNFLRMAAAGLSPASLDEAETQLATLDKDDTDASRIDLSTCTDPKLMEKLETIRATDIHRLRNKVVHGVGYRPTLEEVNAALHEAKGVLFVLPSMLGVKGEEIGLYMLGL
jgi:hypothetical protein